MPVCPSFSASGPTSSAASWRGSSVRRPITRSLSTEIGPDPGGDGLGPCRASAWPLLFYRRAPGIPARLAGRFPGLYRLLVGKYYVDEAYDAAVVRPLVRGSEWVYRHFDLGVIDGALNGAAAATRSAGRGLSLLQSGLVRDYALAFLLGAILFLGFLLI